MRDFIASQTVLHRSLTTPDFDVSDEARAIANQAARGLLGQ